MTITGADLPQELFRNIIGSLTLPTARFEDLHYVRADKRELGRCALVCRYWGVICQQKIFYAVKLCSSDDVHQLLALCDHPFSRIKRYIEEVIIPPLHYPCLPWIHLLPLVYRKTGARMEVSLTVEGPLLNSQSTLRSIHAALPKAPPTFSQHICELQLRSIHLRRFVDLLHLVQELRDLDDLRCQDVSWSGETPLAKLPVKKMRPKLVHSITFTGCTEDWCAAWLSVAMGLSRDLVLTEQDWVAALECGKVLEGGFSAKQEDARIGRTVHTELLMNWADGSYGLHCKLLYDPATGGPRETSPEICFAISRPPLPPHAAQRERVSRIHTVSLDFSGTPTMLAYALESNCDWLAFNERLARLVVLGRIVVGFVSEKDMSPCLYCRPMAGTISLNSRNRRVVRLQDRGIRIAASASKNAY